MQCSKLGSETNCLRLVVPLEFEHIMTSFYCLVRLHSYNAQMTSKRGKNKEIRYEPQVSSVADVLTTFLRPLCVISIQTHGKMKSICFIQQPGLLTTFRERKTFKLSCDPLNYSIIRKNFTNNIFKTNLYSRRNFEPQNTTACQSLHCVICDRLLAITGFLSANLDKYFLPCDVTTKF